MKLHKHFLPNDLKQASFKYWETLDSITTLMNQLNEGNVGEAKRLSVKLTMALHEMEKLNDKKRQLDRHNEIINHMNMAGIHIDIFRGQYFDK